MKRKAILSRLLFSVLGAALMGALVLSSALFPLANQLSDFAYQRPGVPTEEIVLIELDERAVEVFGPMPWPRNIMAEAVEYLNADPEARPRVIGIDTTYIGESELPEADAALVEAAARYGNVVTASTATIGEQLTTLPDGSFYMDEHAVIHYEEPFAALRAVTVQGHINGMLDFDGVLRHAIWQIDVPDGRSIPSFHQSVYRLYMEAMGEDVFVVPPTDARHMWYVPYQASPGAFSSGFSIADLMEGGLDSAHFADKIVLIGPYTQGMQDDYVTAIDHAIKMYGVEYQANAIAALLAGDVKTEILRTPQLIFVIVLSFFAFMWFYDRGIRVATIVWFAGSFLWIGFCLLAFEIGYVLHVLYVPLGLSGAYLVSVAGNYTRAALEKRRITNTFERYVAPEIVQELLQGDREALQLGGDLKEIAVLFVDIRGFTTLSERMDAPTVVEIVNRYLTLTSQCIFQNGGTLDKYVGDCTMAFWGAPLPHADPVNSAVQAALDMVEGAKAVGDALMAEYGQSVSFGVGVHYGPAVVGNIGSPRRMDYTAIGDTVNTAARLESNAKQSQLLVSAAVVERLSERFTTTSLGSITLKGKSGEFEVFEVTAGKG